MSMFTVDDASELFVLHAAINEAKLPLLSYNDDLSASPILGAMGERVGNALQMVFPRNDDWRQFGPMHVAWKLAVNRALAEHQRIRTWTGQQKIEYIRALLSPYRNDDEVALPFLDHVEAIIRERSWYMLWLRTADPARDGVAFLREREDGSFHAMDVTDRNLINAKDELSVCRVLVGLGFDPLGYHVTGDGYYKRR